MNAPRACPNSSLSRRGSGIAAQQLSAGDVGLQLLENSLATVFGLTVLILQFGPVSGAHFNPAVTFAVWVAGQWAKRGHRYIWIRGRWQ